MNYQITLKHAKHNGELETLNIEANGYDVDADTMTLRLVAAERCIAVFHPHVWMYIRENPLTGSGTAKSA